MSKIVWTFGLIAGAILAVMMFLTIPFEDEFTGKALIIGYATMVAAFLMVYYGIRSYRDDVRAGTISFGEAFKTGILIALIASSCYVSAWEVIYRNIMPNFTEKYAAVMIEKARASGASAAALEATRQQMAEFAVQYKKPLIRMGYSLIEVFPVGLVFVLVSAGILSRKRGAASA